MSSALIPQGPYSIEPRNDPDDGSEYGILDGASFEIATAYGRDDVPGSAKAVADLILDALERDARGVR